MVRPMRVYLKRKVKDYLPGIYSVGSLDLKSGYVTLEQDETTKFYYEGPDVHVTEPMVSTGYVDKNRIPVYEGDLVLRGSQQGEVVFSSDSGRWEVIYPGGAYDLDSSVANEIEVKGTIHGNRPAEVQNESIVDESNS